MTRVKADADQHRKPLIFERGSGSDLVKAEGVLWRTWSSVAHRLQVPVDGTWLAIAIGGGLLLGMGILIAAILEPEKVTWFPKCPIRQLTGLDCPGCGTARAIHAIAHGDWKAAFRYNALLFVAMPMLLGIIVNSRWARSTKVAWTVFGTVVGWMIVRNLV